MKKLLLVLILSTSVAMNSNAFGIGAEYSVGGNWGAVGNNEHFGVPAFSPGSIGVSLGFGQLTDPWALAGLGFVFHRHGLGINGHFDWAIKNWQITNWYYLYINAGIGLNTAFWLNDNKKTRGDYNVWNLGVVGRLPLGMRFVIVDNHLEIFLELVPNLGLGVNGWVDNFATDSAGNYDPNGSGKNDDGGVGVGLIGGIAGTIGVRWWF